MLRNAKDGGGGACMDHPKLALRRYTIQRYYRYEGVTGGVKFSEKRVTQHKNDT